MRILHLTISSARGGRRDAILTLMKHLSQAGVECGFVALRNATGPSAGFQPPVDFAMDLGQEPHGSFSRIRELRRLCRDRQVDVIHAHDAGSQYVASMLRLVAPTRRAVMTFHRSLGIDTDGARNQIRNAATLPLIARVLTGSAERRRYFLSKTLIQASKVQVIPFGVDLGDFHPDPSSRPAVLAELGLRPETVLLVSAGHLGAEKGVDQVIAGLARAAAELESVPWHLVVLGSGTPDREAQLRDAASRELAGKVTFAGFRTDMPRWLQSADLLIHAPRIEAFGLVLVQALACGVPVVSTAVGGIPEVVEAGVSGMLVPDGNIPALARAIVSLVTDPDARAALARAARPRAVSQFDARLAAERHRSLYHEVLQ